METDFFSRGGGRDCRALSRFFDVFLSGSNRTPLYRLMVGCTLRCCVESDTKSRGGKGASLHPPRKRGRGSLPLKTALPLPRSNELGATAVVRSVCCAWILSYCCWRRCRNIESFCWIIRIERILVLYCTRIQTKGKPTNLILPWKSKHQTRSQPPQRLQRRSSQTPKLCRLRHNRLRSKLRWRHWEQLLQSSSWSRASTKAR